MQDHTSQSYLYLGALALALGGCTLTGDDFAPVAAAGEAPACVQGGCGEALPNTGSGSGAPASRPTAPSAGSQTPAPAQSPLPASSVPGDVPGGGPGAGPARDAGVQAQDGAAPLSPVELVGWASMPGLGVSTTDGGGSALPLLVTSAAELLELAARAEPLSIAFAGTLDVGRLELASDKTLIGLGKDAILRGGIRIRGSADEFVSNVIVKNLTVDAVTSQVDGDGIQVHYAHHVWIDHCEVKDAADGLIDIVHGSDFVTLSHNRFAYTAAAPDPAHRFANLIGHDLGNGSEDAGHLNVTLHHNWWSSGVSQTLFARFGKVHVFDNYFASPGNTSVLVAGLSAALLVENNFFEAVLEPHAIVPLSSAGVLASGNVYQLTTGARDENGRAFVPVYPYVLDAAADLPARVSAEAGPQ